MCIRDRLGVSLDEPVHDLVCMGSPLFQDGALVAVGALAHQAVDQNIVDEDVVVDRLMRECTYRNLSLIHI